jgi:hypothetical protein
VADDTESSTPATDVSDLSILVPFRESRDAMFAAATRDKIGLVSCQQQERPVVILIPGDLRITSITAGPQHNVNPEITLTNMR